MTLAAVAHQEGDKIGQCGEDGAVDDRATLAAAFDQASLLELVEMERNARRLRTIQRFGNCSRRAPVSAGHHQETNNP